MKIRKSYKFRFYPTDDQVKQLAVEFGCARFVWNHALHLRQAVYEHLNKKNMNYIDIGKHLTFLKRTERFGWLKDATTSVLTNKLIDLDVAYENFFNGFANFPKFKKKSHAQCIRYAFDQRYLRTRYEAGKFLKITNLGVVKVRWSQVPMGNPKMITVSKTSSGKYFLSFSCEIDKIEIQKTGNVIGIDIGVKDVVVSSDGFHSGSPKFTYKYHRELKTNQRQLSRKTKGSNRYNKQRIKVAKVYEKIVNCRKDFLHKLTTKLVVENDLICIEDLNVAGMMKNKNLARAIGDIGIHELNRQLKYKCDWYGKKIVEISRWFPSTKTCSQCQSIKAMKLIDRIYKCECGLILDRDLNAALNIKRQGMSCVESQINLLSKQSQR